MSGTSLDGTDIAYCIFEKQNYSWNFKIIKAQTISYSAEWKNKLRHASKMPAQELIMTHVDYGHYLGKITLDFIKQNNLDIPDLIASHGHTVYHQPGNKLTFQIGDGSAIAAQTHCTVTCDFRSMNVAFGGQGAPLVPIGDELLFKQYDFCLNLGGFANISFATQNKRLAFDICPVNHIINHLVQNRREEVSKILDANKSVDYDADGKIASKGKKLSNLINELNELDYYHKNPPKSLGAEWVAEQMLPIIKKYEYLPLQDILRSYYEHITYQLKKVIKNNNRSKMLITGGGAYNTFLIALLKDHLPVEVCIPGQDVIEYKEALIFAFLGVLRINKTPNILKTASGGSQDSIGGAIYEG